MKTKKNIMEILKHVYLLIITFIVLTPIYYLLVTTFKSGTEAAAKPMALPSFWDITPYINAFEKMQYPRAFGNTLFITICAVFGIVMCSTMCGYVLNRKEKSKITKIIFLVILSGMMFPYQMAVLGLYKLVRSLEETFLPIFYLWQPSSFYICHFCLQCFPTDDFHSL